LLHHDGKGLGVAGLLVPKDRRQHDRLIACPGGKPIDPLATVRDQAVWEDSLTIREPFAPFVGKPIGLVTDEAESLLA
jgi:hypothetical protein